MELEETKLPAETKIVNPEASLRITLARPEEAILVNRLMHEAFAELTELLNPPSGALHETVAETAMSLEEGGALLGWIGEEAVASVRFRIESDYLYVGRLGVIPRQRGRGIASAIMDTMEIVCRTVHRSEIQLGTRQHLTKNLALYRKLGYEIVKTHPHPRGSDTVVWFRKAIPAK